MSQKKRRQQAEAPEPEPPPETRPGAEAFRRTLLGVFTALVVARPVVLGEDPGMIFLLSDTSHLVLTLLWFVTLFNWALWRYFARATAWYFGAVECGLLLAVAGVGLSVLAAGYKHPAALIAWEWAALFAALFLVRQLAVTDADRARVVAVLMASVVSISAYAVYQSAVELPRMGRQYRSNQPAPQAVHAAGGGLMLAAADRAGPYLDAPPLEAQVARQLELNEHAFGTYSHPNTFAGYLVLFLPAVATAAWLLRRAEGRTARAVVAALALGLVAVALWLTHGRGAMFGLAVAAVGAAVLAVVRGWLSPARGAAVAAVAAGFALALQLGVLDEALGKNPVTAADRLGHWKATWRMIKAHVLTGVGAGNFSREYPAYMAEGDDETAADPHNFVLELWSTSGPLAAAGVLAALGAFFWLVARHAGGAAAQAPLTPDPSPPSTGERGVMAAPTSSSPPPGGGEEEDSPRWEFYLGGMAGLLLGHGLKVFTYSPDQVLVLGTPDPAGADVLLQGLLGGGRAIVWFAAFAVFESVRWTRRALAVSLAAGVLALVVSLCVSGGIGMPSLATFLWVAVGLGLAALPLRARSETVTRPGRQTIALMAPLPVTLAVALTYFLYVFVPVTEATSSAYDAAVAVRESLDPAKAKQIASRQQFLKGQVVNRLDKATELDPGNARWHAHLGTWRGYLWQEYASDPRLVRYTPEIAGFKLQALAALAEARRLDPRGREPRTGELRLRLLFAEAQRLPDGKDDRRQQYAAAVSLLLGLIDTDPTNPVPCFQLAQVFFAMADLFAAAGDTQGRGAALEDGCFWANAALDKNAKLPGRLRQLNPWQILRLKQYQRVT